MAEAVAADVQNGSFSKAPAAVFSSLKPQLAVAAGKADEAVRFYKAAFGAEELGRVSYPKRKAEQEARQVLCAELKIGSMSVLVCDQIEENVSGDEGLKVQGGVLFRLVTEDVATAVDKAVEAGATLIESVGVDEGPCGGDTVGKVKDPFGFLWAISSTGGKCCDSVEADA